MSGILDKLSHPFRYLASTLSNTHISDMETTWTTEDENLAIYTSLSKPSGKRPALPAELIYQILDHPSRWICGDRSDFPAADVEDSANPPILQVRASTGDVQMKVVVSSKPLSANDITYLREIAFTFTSKDQGHSWDSVHHGTYEGAHSWFEAGVRHQIPQKSEQNPSLDGQSAETSEYNRFELQRNRHAGKHPEKYRIELGLDDEMVKNLREGDVIELLALAQYPMWSNIVYCAGLEVWKVDNIKAGA